MADLAPEANDPSATQILESYLVLREGAVWREIYRLPLNGALITLGRDPGNRIVLSDDRCSRTHCAIYYENTGWFIRDLGSRNGTTVNGRTG